MSVPTRIAVIAVGDPSRHDAGDGGAMLSRLRDRALKRPFPPGTVLAECDLDPGRLIRLWDYSELTVVLEAVHPTRVTPAAFTVWKGDTRQSGQGRSSRADSARPSRWRGS